MRCFDHDVKDGSMPMLCMVLSTDFNPMICLSTQLPWHCLPPEATTAQEFLVELFYGIKQVAADSSVICLLHNSITAEKGRCSLKRFRKLISLERTGY